MIWFGRSKKKETIDNEAKHTAKLKKMMKRYQKKQQQNLVHKK